MRKIICLILGFVILATSSFAQEKTEKSNVVFETSGLTLTELQASKIIAKEFRQRLKTKLDLEAALKGLAVEDWQERSAQPSGNVADELLQFDLPDEEKNKIALDARFAELTSTLMFLALQGFLYQELMDKTENSEWSFPEEVHSLNDLIILGDYDERTAGKINNVERLQRVLFAHRRAVEITGKVLAQLKAENPKKYEESLNKIFQMREESFHVSVLDKDEIGLKKGTRIIYATLIPYHIAIAKIAGRYKIVALTFYSE